jgi:hypothetical protein
VIRVTRPYEKEGDARCSGRERVIDGEREGEKERGGGGGGGER